MNGDILVLFSGLFGLLLKRLTTPPRWKITVPDVVEILIGSGVLFVLYILLPAGWIDARLTDSPIRLFIAISLIGFFAGPGIVAVGKAMFYERLPAIVRGMLPPNGGTPPPKEEPK